MAIETNEDLGIQISVATKPQVEDPKRLKTVAFADTSTGTAVLLNSSGYSGEELVAAAEAALIPELANLNGSSDELELAGLFFKTSEAIERNPSNPYGYGGVNATAIRMVMSNDGAVMSGVYAHVGNNRAYLVSREGEVRMLTIDGGYQHEGRYPILYGLESRGLAYILDMARTAEDLQTLLKNPELETYWRNMRLPMESLGYSKLKRMHAGTEVLATGNSILMTTLGIHRSLHRGEVTELLRESDPAQALVDAAHTRSSTRGYFRATPDQDYAAIVIRRIP